MNGLEAIIAGAIQGTVEWLPISSEAQTMLYLLNYLHMNPQISHLQAARYCCCYA